MILLLSLLYPLIYMFSLISAVALYCSYLWMVKIRKKDWIDWLEAVILFAFGDELKKVEE